LYHIAGALTFLWPGVTVLLVLSFIAGWSILTGIFTVATALRLRKLIENEWLLILSGSISILFGILLIVFPGPGALSLVWLIGVYALLFGVLTLALSLRLRRMRATIGRHAAGVV